MEEVVITGMGCVSALGNSPDVLWDSLLAGKSGITPITRFDATNFTTKFSASVNEFVADEYFSSRDQSRYSRSIQYAVYSAYKALADAGVDPAAEDPSRAGVIIGSGIGGMKIYTDTCVAYATRGPSRVSPFFIPMAITNMPAGEVSNRIGWMGPCFAVTSACATSNHAIAAAYDAIRLGRADIMLAGGADETVNEVAVAGFCSMKALSKRNDDPTTASRPFDVDRDGFVIGEGAGVLVLESLSHAQKRGAKILARVAGVGMSADAHHMSAPREDGEGVRMAIEMALRDAKISASDVGYVNTHGTSTPLGDVAECSALEKVFGLRDTLKINSSKCMIGHALGAAGALEAIITIKSLQNQMIHATTNVFNQDERIHFDVCANKNTAHSFKYAMSDGFGFGGHNSVVLLAKD
ncbi:MULTISPECIES: beta-ketoacyl-ACP synthase II [unclassified Fibrobacter]|uniref:beta-ketoacyl-ACP synthase II n=1 Tax=unclassified Fibrobacter TaxID=2634177 RepID=UPI000921F03A|nr:MULTISPECIES: beta-ketoacyl-ACP synthase II [unclassified Fibrobacter]MCQ2101181.1 beta-ketoacyl-ACP synthase II [Fibrobacter sp.]MDO4947853.1 beta-ketoacyl-ACP synthase II [Fibrobacter sp.]OWV06368.1 beta-ketoacyl-[acyl-carrier-protein] synthase II [Fibrobacter sp. UWH3]OWV15068.1 beta-ketoacyl-[acyl-carrier-protein] synthase II [Fibrobacter sp. UWH1]SHL41397.1 3-oxoacyl-[acyl-carrier-protein] synthase II [Fibrobacter sp. UWH5]